MSFLDLNLNDVPELEVLADGEYELRVTGAELKSYSNAKGAGQFISLSFDCPAEPNSKGIYHTLFLPNPGDDEKKRNNALRSIKYFCDAFGVDYSQGIDIEGLVGVTGWAILKTESSEDYGDQNRIRRFVTGH